MGKKGKISTGLFIPRSLLEEAHIFNEDIEIELVEKEIRIHPTRKVVKNTFTERSALWECVGAGETKGINGKDHDQYLYDEEK
jgi:antitoxin component of MazEF toxin-antitoxin module